jgi:hypothetical protein
MNEDSEAAAAAQGWLDGEFVPELRRNNLDITETARELFTLVLCGQVREGLVRDGESLSRMLRRLDVKDLIVLYTLKYGRRRVTVNRAVRLLADLHDPWVAIRSDEAASGGG